MSKFSTQITWLSDTFLRGSLCRKFSLTLAILLETYATQHFL